MIARASNLVLGVLIVLGGGCALQATGGPVYSGNKAGGGPVAVVGFGVSSHVMRESTAILGIRMDSVVDDDGISPRDAIMHAGADLRAIPGRLVIEPGVDLGIGEPGAGGFDALGAYAGVGLAARLRLFGVDDDEPAFNIIAPSLELVAGARAGGWMPAEGAESAHIVHEFAFELGLRVAIGSDLFTPTQGRIQEADGLDAPSQGGGQ